MHSDCILDDFGWPSHSAGVACASCRCCERSQTRLTALDLIAYCSADERDTQFVNLHPSELEPLLATIKDGALKHTLAFGVGIHHAGLCESDRTTVERLFVSQAIMVLVCTSTLAWGVNFPAHLVVVKGTEFYDAKTKRYVEFPATEVLCMQVLTTAPCPPTGTSTFR